ncbi:FG-GAP-like repeat-containing protein [Streptomyces sp. NPDC050392]|uniref:FG-GAP-like repeat-containing protein n=1 Tax=Streptomyces sp. NPDC050392 TaxID=3155782 RepID=UPI00343DC4C2
MSGKRPFAAVVGVATAVVLGAAVLTVPLASTAQAEPGPQVILPAATSDVPVKGRLVNAGPHGYLRVEEGRGAIWRSYHATADTQVDPSATLDGRVFEWGTGSDVVAQYRSATRTVELRNMVSGTVLNVPLPSGHSYLGSFGWNVLTRDGFGKETRFHVLDLQTGEVRDRLIDDMAGLGSYAIVPGLGDEDGMVISAGGRAVWLDVAQRRTVPLPAGTTLSADGLALTRDHLLVREGGKVFVYSREDFTRAQSVHVLDEGPGTRLLGMVGNELIIARHDPALGGLSEYLPVWRIDAEPLDGAPVHTVLARSIGRALATPNGGLLVQGGPTESSWAVQLIDAEGPEGPVARATPETRIPSPAVPNSVHQLSLRQGRLTSVESVATSGRAHAYSWTAERDGDGWAYGGRQDRGTLPEPPEGCSVPDCPKVEESGDGRLVYGGPFMAGTAVPMPLHSVPEGTKLPGATIDTGSRSRGLIGSSGRWAVISATLTDGSPEARVVNTDTGLVTRKFPVHPYALSGTTLWTAESNDTAVGYDIRTGAVTESAYIPGCLLDGIQGIGHWLLWNCAGPRDDEGIYDLRTRTITPLGIGYGAGAQLGDGFVVYPSGGRLKVKELAPGGTTQDIGADVSSSETAWAVDPADGTVAWADRTGGIHVVDSGAGTAPVVIKDTDIAATQAVNGGKAPWKPRWWLSKPVAPWTLTLRNKATGTTVRTLSGGTARGLVAASWDGKDTAGRLVANGAYTWTLSAKPVDGRGAALAVSGSVKLTGGAAVPRDFAGNDGFGDLLAFTAAGAADFRAGTGTGSVDARLSGSGWSGANAVTAAVPFDDVSGDRCNDVLVRVQSGELRAYKPSCGGALKPTTAYTKVGAGWNVYDALTSPGDLTGDGRADVLAREKATGYLFLYESRGAGVFKARVKIGTGWKGYLLAGAGDVTGDGRGDLLARDAAGVLWRYAGTGKGTLAARVKVGGGWQVYNSLVGVGDLSGDGKADLLARDTSGVLWSYRGDGKGLFSARTRVGGGWQTYSRLA